MTDPDRPRYRVLVTPYRDRVPCVHQPDHRHAQTNECAPGYALEVTRVDHVWRLTAGERAYAPIGVVGYHTNFHVDVVRDTVVTWLRQLVAPLETRVTVDDVEVYRLVMDR